MIAAAAVIAAIGAAIWAWRLGRLVAQRRRGEVLASAEIPRVSLIVPARNEAHNLPALLASLRALDPPPHEIVVVDDHSTDGTGDLARAAGAIVVTPPPLPPGWLGKPWACHHGAQAATGDLLLFTDADTVHAPDSLGRATARMRRTGAALLSVVPTHVAVSLWEKLQGVFQLLLLVACGVGGAGKGERRFSIGQYLLFRRDAYEAVGGHPAVKHRVAEDLAFARMVADSGRRFELLYWPGLMSVRMYPEGLGAFWRGWRRNVREGLASSGVGGVLEMIAVNGWLLGVPLVATALAASGDLAGAAPWAAAYALTVADIARRQRAVGDLPWWGAIAYPAFVVLFTLVTVAAVVDRVRRAPVKWRGRSVATTAAVLVALAAAAPAADAQKAPKRYDVKVVTLTEQPVITKKATVPEAEVADTMQALMIELFLHATTKEIDVAGPPFARIMPGDQAGTVVVEAGLPTVKPQQTRGEIVAGVLPAGKAATVLHVGKHEDLPKATRALEAWLVKTKRKPAGAMWTVFLTTPVTQKDPAKHRTKVFVPLESAPGK